MPGSDRRICPAGTLADGKGHICAFFHSMEEARRTLLPFIAGGLERGDKTDLIVNANDRDEHLQWLRDSRIEVDKLTTSGQLEVFSWPETYLRSGAFHQQDAIRMIRQLLADARLEGFSRVRGIGDMQWARENRRGVEDAMEYEAQLNSIIANDDVIMCVYDLTRFSGAEIIDVIRTHPAALIGGVLQQNPFFIPPEQFLEEFHGRTRLSGSRDEREP